MIFKYPDFLWALLLGLIPILIHLFNFKQYKVVYFSNTKLLKDIKQQTQSTSRLRHLLVLLSRILFISSLVLLFAQPYIPNGIDNSKVETGILLDNSFSMNQVNQDGRLLDNAKRFTLELLDQQDEVKKLYFISNSLKSDNSNSFYRNDLNEIVSEVDETEKRYDLNFLLERLKGRMNLGQKQLYVFSDFQRNQIDLSKIEKDTSTSYNLVHLKGNQEVNLVVDSVYFEENVTSVNTPYNLFVRVSNQGKEEVQNVNVSLLVDGVQKAIGNVSIAEGSHEEIQLGLTFDQHGVHHCRVKIDDPNIKYDNTLDFTVHLFEQSRVLELYATKPSKELFRLISIVDEFELEQRNYSKVAYDQISTFQLIVLNEFTELSTGLVQELKKFVENGGDICIIPSITADESVINSSLNPLFEIQFEAVFENKQKLNPINIQHPFFKDVFNKNMEQGKWNTPFVNKFFYAPSTNGNSTLLNFENGAPFLLSNSKYGGNQYVFTAAIDSANSDFYKNGLFVPIMLKMIQNSRSQSDLYYTVGNESRINLTDIIDLKSENNLSLKEEKSDLTFIPAIDKKGREVWMDLNKMELKSGNYKLFQGNDEVFGFSLNNDRKESIQDYYTIEELENLSKYGHISVLNGLSNDFLSSIVNKTEEKNYWTELLIASLCFLLLEIVLLRVFD